MISRIRDLGRKRGRKIARIVIPPEERERAAREQRKGGAEGRRGEGGINAMDIDGDGRECYSTKEVAKLLCRSVPTIKRWKKEGKFPQARINKGRTVLWTKDQLHGWIRESSDEPGA